MYRSPEALIKITGTRLQHREETESEKGEDISKASDTTLSKSASLSDQKMN
jgi:hypothetical protein